MKKLKLLFLIIFVIPLVSSTSYAQNNGITYCQDKQVIHTAYYVCLVSPPKKCHYDLTRVGELCVTQFTPESPFCVDLNHADQSTKLEINNNCPPTPVPPLPASLPANVPPPPPIAPPVAPPISSTSRPATQQPVTQPQTPIDRTQQIKDVCKDDYDCEVYIGICPFAVAECKADYDKNKQAAIAFENTRDQYARDRCGSEPRCLEKVKACYSQNHNNATALNNCTQRYLPVITPDIQRNIVESCKGYTICINKFGTCLIRNTPQGQIINSDVYDACESSAKDETNPRPAPIKDCEDNQVTHIPFTRCDLKKQCHFDTLKDGENCNVLIKSDNAVCVDATNAELNAAGCTVAAPANPVITTQIESRIRTDCKKEQQEALKKAQKGVYHLTVAYLENDFEAQCFEIFSKCIERNTPIGQSVTDYFYGACKNQGLAAGTASFNNTAPQPSAPANPVPAPATVPSGGQINQNNGIFYTKIDDVYALPTNACSGHFLDSSSGQCRKVVLNSDFKAKGKQTQTPSCDIGDRDDSKNCTLPGNNPPSSQQASVPQGGSLNSYGTVFYTDINQVYNLNPNSCGGYYFNKEGNPTACYPIHQGFVFNRQPTPYRCQPNWSGPANLDFCSLPTISTAQDINISQDVISSELSQKLISCRGVPQCEGSITTCYTTNKYRSNNWRVELDKCVADALGDVRRVTQEGCGINRTRSPYTETNSCTNFINSCMTNDGDSYANCLKAWNDKGIKEQGTAAEAAKNDYVTEICGTTDTDCRTGVAQCYDSNHLSASDLAGCSIQFLPKISADSQAQINSDCNNDQNCINKLQSCLYKTPGLFFTVLQYQTCLTQAKSTPAGGQEETDQPVGKGKVSPEEEDRKYTITVEKYLAYIHQSIGPAESQTITLTPQEGPGTSTSSSPAVFANLPEGNYVITSTNPDNNLYDINYFVCNADCSSATPSLSSAIVALRNSDMKVVILYVLKVPYDITRQLEACGNQQVCIQKVDQCLKDYNSGKINQAGLAQCGLEAAPQDLSTIDSDIESTCKNKSETCSENIRQCITTNSHPYLNKKDYQTCLSLGVIAVGPAENQGNASDNSITPSIAPTPNNAASSRPSPSETTTPGRQTPIAPVPSSDLELSINGDIDESLLVFTPGEEVNLGAKLYNDAYKPNDGCPFVTVPIGMAIKFESKTENIPLAIYPCTPASFTLPEKPGDYSLTGYFPGQPGTLRASNREIHFTITDTPSLETTMIAHINGLKSYTTTIQNPVVNIGGRVFVSSAENCLITKIHLKLTKVADERGTIVNKIIKEDDFDNCTSYPVSLATEGAGNYTLDAEYSSDKIYLRSFDHASLTVTNNTNSIPTVTQISGGTLTQSRSLTFKATTTVQNNSNPSIIPIINIVINQVERSGDSQIIFNQQVINGQTITETVENLQNTDRFEITADFFPDAGSLYEPSNADLVIVNQTANDNTRRVEAEPYLTLTTYPDNPSAADNLSVVATTNQFVQNPTFKVTKNGQNMSIDPSNITSINSCQDGTGNCQYSLALYELNGTYQISFCTENNLCDAIEFITYPPPPSREISEINLTLNGENTNIPSDGNTINLFLTGNQNLNSQTVYFQVKYSNGDTMNIPLVLKYENPSDDIQSSPEPSSSDSTTIPSDEPQPAPTDDDNQTPPPPTPEPPQGECDDIYYFDENVESCIHKWSKESFPSCSYTFDPDDNASCQ